MKKIHVDPMAVISPRSPEPETDRSGMRGAFSVSLRQLGHVRMLAQERSFSRAATRLNLTASALSHSIALLEKRLSMVLFQRHRSGISVTSEGQVIVDHAISVLSQLSEMESAVDRIVAGSEGEVAFGIGPYPASVLLSPLMKRLAHDYPGIRCVVEVRPPTFLGLSLKSGATEFVICSRLTIPPESVVIGDPLTSIGLQTRVRRGHPMLARAAVERVSFIDYPLILNSLSERGVILDALGLDGHAGRIHLIEDVHSSAQITRETDAIWLLAPDCQSMRTGLVPLHIDQLDMFDRIEVLAVNRRGRLLSRAATNVLATLRMVAAGLQDAPD